MSFSDLNRSANWLLTLSRSCSQTFRIFVGEGLEVGEIVDGSGTADGDGLEEADGLVVLVTVPEFQMSLLPNLMHVNVLFPSTCLVPILAQEAPLLTAENAGVATIDAVIEMAINVVRSRFTDSK